MIHVVIGPPCAGRSTYVKEHAKAGELRVDFDAIAQTLGASSKHESEGLVKDAAFKARDVIIDLALKNSKEESWIIHTKPTAKQMESYKSAGAEFIELDPGKDVCLERAKADERPPLTYEAIEKWYSGSKSGGKGMNFKEISVKANENGTIEGYASTWDREPDSYGDIVKQGAFTKSLEKWKESGRNIPLLWAHGMSDIKAFIGTIIQIEEDEKGLHFVAKFDDTPEAQRVRELYKDGRLAKFSFAFEVKEAGPVTLDSGIKANELRELDIFEISCVTVPANSHAEVIDIKDGEVAVKVGKRNSKSDADAIKQAISILQALIDEPTEDTEEQEEETTVPEDEQKANEASEEPTVSNETKNNLLAFIKSFEKES